MFWSNYFSNPKAIYIKKYLYEVLKDKYIENEKFIDRITNQLTLDSDAQDFIKLSGDLFQKGYLVAVDQHKEALSKIGMNTIITANPDPDKHKIFQSEKSG
jgi:hypothetical protein